MITVCKHFQVWDIDYFWTENFLLLLSLELQNFFSGWPF